MYEAYEENTWRSLHDVVGAVLATTHLQSFGAQGQTPDTEIKRSPAANFGGGSPVLQRVGKHTGNLTPVPVGAA